MRPLMATVLEAAEVRSAPGRYDEAAGVSVGQDGRPLVLTAPEGETLTKVVNEPADDERIWAFETQTMTVNEPADDARAWALETETRVVNEPADDERIWAAAGLNMALPPADDSSTGLVSF
jgi:hypothetical protein